MNDRSWRTGGIQTARANDRFALFAEIQIEAYLGDHASPAKQQTQKSDIYTCYQIGHLQKLSTLPYQPVAAPPPES